MRYSSLRNFGVIPWIFQSSLLIRLKTEPGLNDRITPYELYLKLIYEYMQEDINLQDGIDTFLPEGFMALQYQQQAVIQALKKLEEYNGVFLSDVGRSGNTFIAAQKLLQQVKGAHFW